MGLSGLVVFLCVIEPSAHLTDPGRGPVMPCQSGLSPSTRRRCSSRMSGALPAGSAMPVLEMAPADE